MRIGGYGSGNGGGHGPGRDRAGTFRRRHRVGERVTGRVLGSDTPGQAWVDFEGIELSARIQSNPAPGSLLLFIILSLDPEILLQELHVAQSQGNPMGPAAGAFWAARARFEALSWDVREKTGQARGGPEAREKAFLAALKAAPEAEKAYAAVIRAVTDVNALLKARGGPMLGYEPWLLPETLSHEILTRRRPKDDGTETGLSFALPGQGQCELRLVSGPGGTGARLFLERPELAGAFEALVRGRGLTPEGLDMPAPATLPPAARAGLLAQILASAPGGLRFARRV
ncbi:hypothetical protein [Desulfocurvus sp. DL9XJH121]